MKRIVHWLSGQYCTSRACGVAPSSGAATSDARRVTCKRCKAIRRARAGKVKP